MSDFPFKIELNFQRRLIITRMTGFWTLSVARAYVEQIRVATAKMRGIASKFDLIMDIGNSPALPRDAAAFLEAEQGKGRPPEVRKMAFLCSSLLGRLQLRRLTLMDVQMAVFAGEPEALAWLDSGG